MRNSLIRILVLLFVFSAPALSRADNLLGLGLGANLISFTNEDSGISNNAEFSATLFADWGLSDVIYLETGLRYTSYGLSGSVDSINLSENVHYLEIPVLLKPTFNAGGWYPYLLAGPEVGFKVGEGASLSANGQSIDASTSIFNTVNFSGDFGAGAEFPIADRVRAFAQFDYELGFVNVFQSSVGSSSHTRGAVISAGAAVAF